MGQIRIELPDELHQTLRIQAITEGTSLRELVIRLLTEATKEGE
jgi:predicted HicB family RNase H-like nuclease